MLITYFIYIAMTRLTDAEMENTLGVVKLRFFHLISKKYKINLKLGPFGEICEGCPLQLNQETLCMKCQSLFKIKKKNILNVVC